MSKVAGQHDSMVVVYQLGQIVRLLANVEVALLMSIGKATSKCLPYNKRLYGLMH